jgi:hypothetical protein
LSETAKKCVLNGDFPVSKFGYLVEWMTQKMISLKQISLI